MRFSVLPCVLAIVSAMVAPDLLVAGERSLQPAAVDVANVPGGADPAPVSSDREPQALPSAEPLANGRPDDDGTLTIVLGGDLGLGGSGETPHPDGASRHGRRHAWSTVTAGLEPLIDGDVNFANLETVVSDRSDLTAQSKAFNFRTHPKGLRHLVQLGFNVLSAANNHAIDYGEEGLRETTRHLDAARNQGLLAWHGLGTDRELALRPALFTAKGARIAFSAVGIGGRDFARTAAMRPGMLSYHRDFADTVSRLAESSADLRILSVHYGMELQVRPQSNDAQKLRGDAADAKGIDIVVGHHAHVAAGVQQIDGKLVFYGLGNLLHQGMQDMGRFNVCRDYGLLARVHLARSGDDRLTPRAVEVVPLTDMHLATRPMPAVEARERIEVLNHLAGGLDDQDAGATGVRFATSLDGTGLHCLAGAENEPGRIGALCRGWLPPPPASPALSRRLASACGDTMLVARARASGRAERQQTAKAASSKKKTSGSTLWSFFQGD